MLSPDETTENPTPYRAAIVTVKFEDRAWVPKEDFDRLHDRLARAEEALREIVITRSGRSGMRRIAQRGLGEDPDAPS
jgi:hypothetical protein